jgi:hypothetical protein
VQAPISDDYRNQVDPIVWATLCAWRPLRTLGGGQIGGRRVNAIVGRTVRAGSAMAATIIVAFGLPGALSYLC